MKTLPDRIRFLLDEKDISVTEMAKIAGVKPPSVSDWLNGKTKVLRSSPAIRISKHFGVNMLWLTEGAGPTFQASKLDGAMEPSSTARETGPVVSEDAQEIVAAYEAASAEIKQALRTLIKQLTAPYTPARTPSKSQSAKAIEPAAPVDCQPLTGNTSPLDPTVQVRGFTFANNSVPKRRKNDSRA